MFPNKGIVNGKGVDDGRCVGADASGSLAVLRRLADVCGWVLNSSRVVRLDGSRGTDCRVAEVDEWWREVDEWWREVNEWWKEVIEWWREVDGER